MALFSLLAHVDLHKLMTDEFKDYKSYFDIILVERNVIKADNNYLFNIYQLKIKQ